MRMEHSYWLIQKKKKLILHFLCKFGTLHGRKSKTFKWTSKFEFSKTFCRFFWSQYDSALKLMSVIFYVLPKRTS